MKILFVSRLFHQVSGGVERMAIVLMNEMVARGHTVELLSWDGLDAVPYYPLDARVVWHRLNLGDANRKAGWGMRLRRQRKLRALLKLSRPDVCIAFQHGPFITLATAGLGLGCPLIAAERNAPHRFDHLRAGKRRGLIFQTFRLANRITVQMEDYIAAYPRYLQGRMVSIPNPVLPATAQASSEDRPDGTKWLLSVGRLSYQKNQRVLIDAFADLVRHAPEWRLTLVGTGEDERALKARVANLGLSGKVEFTGAVRNVEDYYLNSDLFCLPSRWEGFPNALAEAMAHALPVVGFEGCAGVNQLIVNGKSGVLARGNGDADTLLESLLPLVRDAAMRRQLGLAASHAMQRFSPEAIFDAWETLFQEVAGER